MRYKKVIFGCDHGGWPLKKAVLSYLRKQGMKIRDLGCHGPEPRVDYPDYASKIAHAVSEGEASYGILCCGTGIGMSIAANKVKGIRAAVVWDADSARLAREHNDANVLCLGGRHFKPKEALRAVEAFFKAVPSCETRHRKRILKISRLEKRTGV